MNVKEIKSLSTEDKIELMSLMLTKQFSEKWENELDFLDGIRSDVYSANRIKKGFLQAGQISYKAILGILFVDDDSDHDMRNYISEDVVVAAVCGCPEDDKVNHGALDYCHNCKKWM